MLAANVSLEKVFDSVLREALCVTLWISGIPTRITNLVSVLFSRSKGAAKYGIGVSAYLGGNSDVR